MFYLKPLFFTIVIELLVVYTTGLKIKKVFIYAALANIITNPLLNFILLKTINYFGEFWFIYILFCEFIVVLFEFGFLKVLLRDYKLPFFKLSFLMNAASFLFGLLIKELNL